MFRIIRAAGFAAAAVGAVLVPTLANPSMAWDAEAAPITSRYTDHAAANVDGPTLAPTVLALNTVALPHQLETRIDFSTPVAEHAVATVDTDETAKPVPAPVPPVESQAKPEPRSLKELVNDYSATEVPDAELECLAGAVYFESKGEPLVGQLAVAEVIINRATSGRFPTSWCGVVKQRSQFSFIRGGRFPAIARSSAAWRTAVAIAQIAKQELADSTAPKALFFHAKYVSPGWKLKRVAAVGNHIFYR